MKKQQLKSQLLLDVYKESSRFFTNTKFLKIKIIRI